MSLGRGFGDRKSYLADSAADKEKSDKLKPVIPIEDDDDSLDIASPPARPASSSFSGAITGATSPPTLNLSSGSGSSSRSMSSSITKFLSSKTKSAKSSGSKGWSLFGSSSKDNTPKEIPKAEEEDSSESSTSKKPVLRLKLSSSEDIREREESVSGLRTIRDDEEVSLMSSPSCSRLVLNMQEDEEDELKAGIIVVKGSEDSSSIETPKLVSRYKPDPSLIIDAKVTDSFEITSESIQVGGYKIKADGIAAFPSDRKLSASGEIKDDSDEEPSFKMKDIKESAGSFFSPVSVFKMKSTHFVTYKLLGRGNSGTVSKAFNLKDHKIYALKSIGVHSKENRHQMVKELDAYHSLQCPHLVKFFGAYFDQGDTVFVLEYMNRGSLQDLIEKKIALDETVLKRIAKQVLLGLKHMHAHHQMHRDIKPANILLNRAGQAKISDFGIAKQLGPMGEAMSFVGTRIYMSPERIKSQKYSFSSDIWSFGLTLFTLATGKFPYEEKGEGFGHLFQIITKDPAPKLPKSKFSTEFRSFISHCLEKDPSARYSARKLLKHPFLKDVKIDGKLKWPWDESKDTDAADLSGITDVLAKKVFKKTPYRRTPENIEMFAKIAESLKMSVSDVESAIEKGLPISCLAPPPSSSTS